MKNNLIYLFSIFSILFLASCSDDDNDGLDNESPVITIHEPTANEVFEVGGEVHIDIDLEDDTELASYKIEIHNDFDGHTHGKPVPNAQTLEPWSFSETYEIEAGTQSFNIHDHLEIPENIAEGDYHFGIFAVDEAGNQSEAFAEITIGESSNEEEHGISIVLSELEDATAGSTLHADAEIQTEHDIETISVEIHGHDLNPTEDQIEWEFDQSYTNYSGTTAEFHEDIAIPENAAHGEYHMTLVVIDDEGHSHAEGISFEVM